MILFTGINKDNLQAMGEFIERNALFGVGIEISQDLLGEELVRIARRYGATFVVRASHWEGEGGLGEIWTSAPVQTMFEALRPESFKIAVTLESELRIGHAVHLAVECPQTEIWLMDTGTLALRFITMEKLAAIRTSEEEFANVQPLGAYQNRYDTVVDFEALRHFKW